MLPLAGHPVMLANGATVSTVHVRETGVESTLPVGSLARTEKVYCPFAVRPA